MSKKRGKKSDSAPIPPSSRTPKILAATAGIVALVAAGIYLVSSRRTPATTRLPKAPVVALDSASRITQADFVGSESCAQCHADQYAAWKGSTHGHAGGPPTPDR